MSIYTDPAVLGVCWLNPKDVPLSKEHIASVAGWLRELADDIEQNHPTHDEYMFTLLRPSPVRTQPRKVRKGGV